MTKICLVGIDGLRWDVAVEVSPTLAHLDAGGHRARMVMEVPTWSGPGWSSLLTGSTIEEHGVRENSFVGSRLVARPDLLSRAFYRDQRRTTFAAAAWPPLVDPVGPGPVIHWREEQQRAGQHRVVVRDGETYGYERADEEVATFAVAGLGQGPDVSFVYFCDADEAAHLHGSTGPQYRAAVARIDARVDALRAVVERRAEAGEDWLFVVTTDHGHLDEGGHGGASERERASFVLARRFGPVTDLEWPEEIAPHELVDLLLDRL